MVQTLNNWWHSTNETIVADHPQKPGEYMRTSRVVQQYRRLIRTQSGSLYRLGKELSH